MEKMRRDQIGDVFEKEFTFFEGFFNAMLMVSPFWIAITVILMW